MIIFMSPRVESAEITGIFVAGSRVRLLENSASHEINNSNK